MDNSDLDDLMADLDMLSTPSSGGGPPPPPSSGGGPPPPPDLPMPGMKIKPAASSSSGGGGLFAGGIPQLKKTSGPVEKSPLQQQDSPKGPPSGGVGLGGDIFSGGMPKLKSTGRDLSNLENASQGGSGKVASGPAVVQPYGAPSDQKNAAPLSNQQKNNQRANEMNNYQSPMSHSPTVKPSGAQNNKGPTLQSQSNIPHEDQICMGCKQRIGTGMRMQAMEGVWHTSCFTCSSCRCELSGQFFLKNGNRFCGKCNNAKSTSAPTSQNICGECRQECKGSDYIEWHNIRFHSHCFVCFKCRGILNISGFYNVDGQRMCQNCAN